MAIQSIGKGGLIAEVCIVENGAKLWKALFVESGRDRSSS
jgi:hypothetical protein